MGSLTYKPALVIISEIQSRNGASRWGEPASALLFQGMGWESWRAARKSLLAVLGNSCPEYTSEYVVAHKMRTEVVWVNAEREVAAEQTL